MLCIERFGFESGYIEIAGPPAWSGVGVGIAGMLDIVNRPSWPGSVAMYVDYLPTLLGAGGS